MKKLLLIFLLIATSSRLYAADISVDLHFEAPVNNPSDKVVAMVKELKGVKISSFTDKRSTDYNLLGEIRTGEVNSRLLSNAALSAYLTDAFKSVYANEWGGTVSVNGPLTISADITQFSFDESEGYQLKAGLRFILYDAAGRVIWDGHTTGLVKGTGKKIGAENISLLVSDAVRAAFYELLEDEKLVGVWSGKASNTYVIRENGSGGS